MVCPQLLSGNKVFVATLDHVKILEELLNMILLGNAFVVPKSLVKSIEQLLIESKVCLGNAFLSSD